MFLNNIFGDLSRLISNFKDDSILELALCILKDKVQSLSIVTVTVVLLSYLKSISNIWVGSGMIGVLYFGSICSNGKFKVPFILYA